MDRRVVWTQVAWDDLEEVVTYISKDSSHYAAGFAREVRAASRTLSQLAERGRLVPELDNPTIREIFVRSYRLLYSVTEQVVFILGLVHGARDLGALWERERRPYG